MKKNTSGQRLKDYREDIVKNLGHWEDISKNGCSDPFWADGVNMNLARNHILHAKERVLEICSQENIPLPEEYYLATPPEVDNNYMADLKQEERVKRLKQYGSGLTTKAACYDKSQLSVFS